MRYDIDEVVPDFLNSTIFVGTWVVSYL